MISAKGNKRVILFACRQRANDHTRCALLSYLMSLTWLVQKAARLYILLQVTLFARACYPPEMRARARRSAVRRSFVLIMFVGGASEKD